MKTVKVSDVGAKPIRDQTVGYPSAASHVARDQAIALDWVTGRSARICIKSWTRFGDPRSLSRLNVQSNQCNNTGGT